MFEVQVVPGPIGYHFSGTAAGDRLIFFEKRAIRA